MYFEYVLDDCDQSDLFRRRVDEQRYSQTDCNVWLKSGIQKGDATASVFSQCFTRALRDLRRIGVEIAHHDHEGVSI